MAFCHVSVYFIVFQSLRFEVKHGYIYIYESLKINLDNTAQVKCVFGVVIKDIFSII